MRAQQFIQEDSPRTLYHGTQKRWLPYIEKLGLFPTVGDFTRELYSEYQDHGIDLEPLVFAADRQGLGKCISAILGPPTKRTIRTADEFYKQAAILVIKKQSRQFARHAGDFSDYHPATVEPQDYYTQEVVYPDFALTDDRLKRFLRRNNIDLEQYGIKDPQAAITQARTLQARQKLTGLIV